MNHYELLYIVAGKYAETEVKGVSDQIDALILKVGGKINFTQYWERRKLAYPIDHLQFGHYVITEFDAEPSKLMEFERQMRLSITEVVRHMIVTKDEVGSPLELTQSAEESDVRQIPDEVKVEPAFEAAPAVAIVTEDKPKKAPVVKASPKPELKEEKTEEVAPEAPVVTEEPIVVIAETPIVEKAAPPKEAKAEMPKAEPEAVDDKPAMKKKKEKVSFEDLDKKLDEILNDLP